MKIASVVVTYNRFDKLKLTVEKTLDEDVDFFIIVNNASTDGTKEWLDTLTDCRLKVIHLDENIGGAGGFNVGFKEVVENCDADWLVCYDDDAYPQSGTIEKFKSLTLNQTVGSIASAVYLPDGKIAEMNRPSLNPFWHVKRFFSTAFKGRDGFHVSDKQYEDRDFIEVDASSFVGYFVRTDVIKKVGLPRKELFIYADDIIYALSVRKAGYKHLFVPQVSFIHGCGTLLNNQDIYKPIWRVYYVCRNRIEMYRFTSGIFFYPITFLKILLWWKKAKYYQNQDLYKKVMWCAIKDGFKRDFSRKHKDIVDLSLNL